MTEINFYEVVVQPFEKTVSNLIRKCFESELNTFVKCSTDEEVDLLDKTIWTFSQKFFIPHAKSDDPEPHRQPILLSKEESVKNNAKILVLVSSDFEDISQFDRVMVIFDENNPTQREFCRELYKKYKSKNYLLKYFKQNSKGSWEEK